MAVTVLLALLGTFELKRVMIDKWQNTKWHWFANYGPAVISATLIVVFGAIYEALAKALTNFENHKTE